MKCSIAYLIRGAVKVCLMSRGAQSPGLGWPLRKASACSGSRADSERSSARNSLRRGLSGSRRRGEPSGRTDSPHTRLGADLEYSAPDAESTLSDTFLSGNAK